MISHRTIRRRLIPLALAGAVIPAGALAQAIVQPLPMAGTMTDADRLATQLRVLAANPRDLSALLLAGELSAKLGDTPAALAFFARAEALDPRSPRVAAGRARVLVGLERPGEALRLFRQAEDWGGNPSDFALDRGLAFDLIGEQQRAQRDYRLALRRGADEEATRRLALSLGISGRGEEAMALLDPLLRRSDRASWRTRAFVLAMTGNARDAEKIAASMMAGGGRSGMEPFFERLRAMTPTDRAWAVHLGRLMSTPARVADARLAPTFAPLGPDPDAAPVRTAAAQPAAKPLSARERRRLEREQRAQSRRRGRTAEQPVAVAAVQPSGPPLPAPPGGSAFAASRATVQPVPSAPARTTAPLAGTQVARAEARPRFGAPESSARRVGRSQPSLRDLGSGGVERVVRSGRSREDTGSVVRASSVAVPPASAAASVNAAPIVPGGAAARTGVVAGVPATASVPPSLAAVAPSLSQLPVGSGVAPATRSVPSPTTNSGPVTVAEVAGPPAANRFASSAPLASVPPRPGPSTGAVVGQTPALGAAERPVVLASSGAETVAPSAPPVTAPAPVVGAAASVQAPAPAAPSAVAPVATAPRLSPGNQVLAAIMANIAVPATELGVQPLPGERAEPAPLLAAAPASAGQAAPPPRLVEPAPSVAKPAPKPAPAAAEPTPRKTEAARKPEAVAKADEAMTKKGAPDKKGAAAKKDDAVAKKAEAAKKPPAKKEPSRVWVQVAGGANKADLPKAWRALASKAPGSFKGRQAWTTPLRFTNRLLTGPFKSQSEALGFVNELNKAGLSGFAYTSPAGQDIERLSL